MEIATEGNKWYTFSEVVALKKKFEERVRLCRIASYIGIGMVLVVYVALSYLSGNLDTIGTIPGWFVAALQLLLGIGSALTVTGIILGMYYKGKSKK